MRNVGGLPLLRRYHGPLELWGKDALLSELGSVEPTYVMLNRTAGAREGAGCGSDIIDFWCSWRGLGDFLEYFSICLLCF